jgi:hypothetical protein
MASDELEMTLPNTILELEDTYRKAKDGSL